jgi:hypothetical protein
MFFAQQAILHTIFAHFKGSFTFNFDSFQSGIGFGFNLIPYTGVKFL